MSMLALLALACGQVTDNQPIQPFTTVFRAGEGNYTSFLNPSLVRLSTGRLLVFSEARRGDGGDGAAIDVGFKLSDDEGASWSVLRSLIPNGGSATSRRGSTLGNLVAFVVNPTVGSTDAPQGRAAPPRSERCMVMLSANNSVGWSIYSDDSGVTWSSPRDVTSQTKATDEGWYATGPANGLVLQHGKPGRVLVPLNTNLAKGSIKIDFELVSASEGRNRPCPMKSLMVGVRGEDPQEAVPPFYATGQNPVEGAKREKADPCSKLTLESMFKMQQRSLVLISDDSGQSWNRSGLFPLMSSETAIAQLSDGSIIARSRMAEDGWQDGCEHFTRSTDFGETWQKHESTPACISEPGVQNSLLSRDEDGAVFLATPKVDCAGSAADECRGNITIYRSDDKAGSWQQAVTILHPHTEYSSMVNMLDGDRGGVGIAHVQGSVEHGVFKRGNIVFRNVALPMKNI